MARLWASRLMHSPSEHIQHITFQLISSQHAGTRNLVILHLAAGLPPPEQNNPELRSHYETSHKTSASQECCCGTCALLTQGLNIEQHTHTHAQLSW